MRQAASRRLKRTHKLARSVSADAVARLADQGEDISRFFNRQRRMVQPIQRVNLDVTASMLEELDKAPRDLNVSRQAVITTLVGKALDQHYLAQNILETDPLSKLKESFNNSGLTVEENENIVRLCPARPPDGSS